MGLYVKMPVRRFPAERDQASQGDQVAENNPYQAFARNLLGYIGTLHNF
jgi:hypothetical protein